MAKGDRLLAIARPRVILPAAGAVWGAAEILHAEHIGALWPALGMAALGLSPRLHRAGAVAAVTAGALIALTGEYGGWGGPDHLVAWAWAAAAVCAVGAVARNPAVREARQRRAARMMFLREAGPLGIHGAHLIDHETTRLGERWVLDTTGTGKLASSIARGNLDERIAQRLGLHVSRVQVTDRSLIAGRVAVSVRKQDPWKNPIPHPLFDPEPELDLPVPCSITEPIVVGQDPETGTPLALTLWDEIGGKVVGVVGKRGAGKDVLLDCIRERVTAAFDADLWEINVSKAQNERAWEPACEYAACGAEQGPKALQILLQARKIGGERGAAHRANTTLRPTKTNRLKVLIINENDALFELPDVNPADVKRELRHFTSKLRSEGFALVFAGQRALAPWTGGTDVKANVDTWAIGHVKNPGEVTAAVGRLTAATLPDMSRYGEGKPGVWCIVDDSGDVAIGRTFELPERGNLDILRELAAERSVREPALVGAGAPPPDEPPSPGELTPERRTAMADFIDEQLAPHHGGEPPASDPPADNSLERLDGELMANLPPDLRATLDKARSKQAHTREILNGIQPPAPLPREDQERRAADRWRELAQKTVIPDDARAKLMIALAGDGMSSRKITEAFPGVTRNKIISWLNRLRYEGLAEPTGKGRAARWARINGDGS